MSISIHRSAVNIELDMPLPENTRKLLDEIIEIVTTCYCGAVSYRRDNSSQTVLDGPGQLPDEGRLLLDIEVTGDVGSLTVASVHDLFEALGQVSIRAFVVDSHDEDDIDSIELAFGRTTEERASARISAATERFVNDIRMCLFETIGHDEMNRRLGQAEDALHVMFQAEPQVITVDGQPLRLGESSPQRLTQGTLLQVLASQSA